MAKKLTFEELERRGKKLENEAFDCKRVEEALRESEERYRGLIEGLNEAIYRMSLPDGRYEYFSPAALSVFGYSEKEFMGNPLLIQEIMHPDFTDYFKREWATLLKGKVPPTFEYKVIDREGKERWIIQSNKAGFDEQGNIVSIEGICRDITARKQAERALMEERDKAQLYFDFAGTILLILNADETVAAINRKGSQVLGSDKKAIVGANWFDTFIPKGDRERTREVFNELMAGNIEPIEYFQNFIQTRKNGARLIAWHNVFLRNEEGRSIATLSSGEDVTERNQAEKELKKYQEQLEELVAARTAELEAKNKELETFTYSVSHDLKAPLRGIDGYSRLLIEEYGEKLDEEGRRFLRNVRQSTEQMNRLIEDLLAYSRMERRDIQVVSVDLPVMIDGLLREREQDLKERNIAWKSDVPFQTILCDRESFRQILGNLLDNAIKFTRNETAARIEINGSETPDDWTLWVKDNGVGFDPKYRERIFGIFQRLHRSEDYPGTGVGLAIAKKAIQRMRGRIWAEGELGKGAVFYVQVPKSNKSYQTKGSSHESQCG